MGQTPDKGLVFCLYGIRLIFSLFQYISKHLIQIFKGIQFKRGRLAYSEDNGTVNDFHLHE